MNLDLFSFGLTPEDVHELDSRTLVVVKENWDYPLAHAFQKAVVKELQESSGKRVLIMCSHPRVFTNGRGLQKAKKGQSLDLVEFNPALASMLPFPFYQIERGGGLTFHHPGQFIVYPIVKLNPKILSLSKMMDDLFEAAISVLEGWGLTGATHENELLGLWHGQRKLASMGIAIERLTTYHGMALNLKTDEEMKQALSLLNPCGLKSETYTSVEELIPLPNRAWEKFKEEFLRKLSLSWRPESDSSLT